MARKARDEEPGAIHHVYALGNNRQPLFADEKDRQLYLAYLDFVIRRQRWRLLAYCLMGNHVHLLVETPEPNLGEGMRELHGRFARRFNRRHGREGHHFLKRYGSTRIRTDAQLLIVVSYIVANPVTAGFCATPEEWPWGSHARIAAGSPPPWLAADRLMEYLGAWGDPQATYERIVAARAPAIGV
ncbi:MAG TPA: transposase [Thermoleophilaceae bacterium]|nr:transposase [Thermoleophilaceae bacterium]